MVGNLIFLNKLKSYSEELYTSFLADVAKGVVKFTNWIAKWFTGEEKNESVDYGVAWGFLISWVGITFATISCIFMQVATVLQRKLARRDNEMKSEELLKKEYIKETEFKTEILP